MGSKKSFKRKVFFLNVKTIQECEGVWKDGKLINSKKNLRIII